MDGLSFTTAAPTTTDPVRMDVACFVGYVARRKVRDRVDGETDPQVLQRLPEWLRPWFTQHGWLPGRADRTVHDLVELIDVPVPIDTWETFDALYAWNARPLDASGRRCDTMMGAAVRRFFAQGGRKCYVIRLGDPWMVLDPPEARVARANDYLGVLPPPSPVDRRTWRGVAHLFGLPDVSFLCLPDLPDFCSTPPSTLTAPPEHVPVERFVECAEPTAPAETASLRGIPPPGCDARGFSRWARLVDDVAEFLSRYARETQLVASVPLPVDARAVVGMPAPERTLREARRLQIDAARSIHSRFVQLVYPWIRTAESRMLPGDVESPEGMYAGLLAANALQRGTWTNLTHRSVRGLLSLVPVQDRATLHQPFSPPAAASVENRHRLRDRVSLVGASPGGYLVLSDVTTAGGSQGGLEKEETYRPASVNRLLAAILRTARLVGEDVVFENSGDGLWGRLREALENFLGAIWADGALAGETAGEAFEVRCDRSTMSQSDIDAGRVIVRLSFTAAVPIVHVAVELAMDEGGWVSLISHGNSAAVRVA